MFSREGSVEAKDGTEVSRRVVWLEQFVDAKNQNKRRAWLGFAIYFAFVLAPAYATIWLLLYIEPGEKSLESVESWAIGIMALIIYALIRYPASAFRHLIKKYHPDSPRIIVFLFYLANSLLWFRFVENPEMKEPYRTELRAALFFGFFGPVLDFIMENIERFFIDKMPYIVFGEKSELTAAQWRCSHMKSDQLLERGSVK